ncbi:HNH endonuclease [Bifidobacterium animalis]|uniref:HNH endonuclease n=1 Tax=Bifidobacterium animalis TaxID=28025 RepID=UPI003BF94F61
MKRDHYRCRLCGKTADQGARLEVDHITPVSKGGKSVLDNLWTLCFECSRGKGAERL